MPEVHSQATKPEHSSKLKGTAWSLLHQKAFAFSKKHALQSYHDLVKMYYMGKLHASTAKCKCKGNLMPLITDRFTSLGNRME